MNNQAGSSIIFPPSTQVIKSEQLICVDVDDTLLLWNAPIFDQTNSMIPFENPYNGGTYMVAAHWPHITVVKQRLARGATIILWSASGFAWAKAAAEACGISGENLICASKPSFYIDDKPASAWMGEPMFMNPKDMWAR
jgi:hypothetical protein